VPFLRVLRDKRGYETTYLMHWFREGSKQRSRVLYMFRTPGGVRVGRTPLDRDVIRQLEAQHPEISFDWNAVRETQQIIEPAPEYRRRKPRREETEVVPEPVAAAAPEPPPKRAVDSAASAPAPRPQIPSALEGASPNEQMAFLSRWYPIVRERLALRTADPERRDALLALAEQLNPVAWTDADQITAGLTQASEALERLSRVMARRRRRSRRSGGESPAAASGQSDADSDSDPGTDPGTESGPEHDAES
jgi:hypothetical protein